MCVQIFGSQSISCLSETSAPRHVTKIREANKASRKPNFPLMVKAIIEPKDHPSGYEEKGKGQEKVSLIILRSKTLKY